LQTRVVMCVDFDYFFAQCEEMRNPSLRDKPVVVCVYSGRTEESGAVSTANYLARRYGVKSGMPIYLAKKKLQNSDAVFLPVNRELYEEVSETTMAILRSFADHFEQAGIDEAYLDISQRTGGNFEEARKVAKAMKDEVKRQQGPSCTIGVGPNKLVAKIAVDAQKPDGLTIVNPEQVENFLSPLPVRRLLGVGAKTEQKLRILGVQMIGELARYDVQGLTEIFGKSLGGYFRRASMGVDDDPVQERSEAESISRISTLKEDTRNMDSIVEKTNQLCEEIHTRLVQSGLVFRSVSIAAVMKDLSIRSRSHTLDNYTDEIDVIKKVSKTLFEELLKGSELDIRRVGVKVSKFTSREEEQRQITEYSSTSTEAK